MNNCQNPECKKEIPDSKKYCGEQCIKRHLEIKKESEIKELKIGGTEPSEIKEIMDVFGIGGTEGNVHGAHLSKILANLQLKRTGSYRKTLAYLALVIGTQQRYIKESYLEGLEIAGIIETFDDGNDKIWKWKGIKALCPNRASNGRNNGE